MTYNNMKYAVSNRTYYDVHRGIGYNSLKVQGKWPGHKFLTIHFVMHEMMDDELWEEWL